MRKTFSAAYLKTVCFQAFLLMTVTCARSVQVIVSQEGSVLNNLYLIIPFYATFSGLAIDKSAPR
ncbi:hypothetical protein [[Clostridium] symbiosum]|uniref:hypothetical protein n=1 Tax=Clostridium symbiosum TaxID=1512 RepID=UPI0002EDFF30|nr:hypothetical protein [[Clostridium] symbiosum]